MARRHLWILLAACALARSAAADVVRDDETGFSMEVDVRPDVPCVLFPRDHPRDAGCATTDVQAVTDALAHQPDMVLWAARVDRGSFAYLVIVTRRPGAGELAEKDVPLVMADLRDSAKSLDARALAPMLWRSNGVQILTAPLSVVVDGGSGRSVSYFIAGAGAYTLTTMTDEAHAADVEAIAKRALATVRLDPPPSVPDADETVVDTPEELTPEAEAIRYALRAVLFVVAVVALAFGLRAIGRLGRRR